jgi:PAS domain S-box-containing protein
VKEVECWYSIRKLQARFFAGDYASAVAASLRAQRMLWTSPSQFETAEFHFYGALSRAACWDSASPDQRRQHFDALAAHHRQLEVWAENCPENFENRAALVGAEIARIEDRDLDAMRLYETAIRSAHTNGFIHNEAVAYEVAGRFYEARGFDKIADTYLREARYGYLRWGADGKVKQLDQLYPRLREEQPIAGPTSTTGTLVEHLDLATVIKVSQAVSGEIVLEKLIDTLMRTAIEHAGAERGLLILPRGDELRIAAEATTSSADVIVRRGEAAVIALPESILHFVARTHECVILDDAATHNNPFSADTYVRQRHARSILCLPLINQAKLIGVLYLENNLTPHVFTPTRIAALKLLASQAAISLENTRLYSDLEEREAKIRRLVDANIMGIFIWNLDGNIVEANEAFCHMVEYTREDIVSGGMRWTDLTPAEWRDRDARALADLNEVGTARPYEKEFFRKNGSRVPVLIGGALFEEGGDEGVAFVLDLSEQKRSEESYRVVVETASDAVISMDENGLILLTNLATKRVFGYDSAEFIGKPVTILMPELLRKAHEAGFRRYLATGQRHINWQGTELVGLRKNGEEFPVEVSFGEQIRNGHRVFTGFVRDISEKKKAEDTLRRSEGYLAEAQKLAHIGAWVWGEAGRNALYLSDEWYRIYRFDPRDGLPTWEERLERVHPEDRAKWISAIDRAVADKADYEVDFRILVPGIGVKHIHTVGHPVCDPAGELVQFVGVSMDVTERKQAEEERERLRQTQADLAHLNRVGTMGELTASLAHEIKQPISAAATDAETCFMWLARDQPDLAEAQDAALRIMKDVTRASEIINRIVSLFKKDTPKREPIDVNGVIQQVIALLRTEASRHSISIHAELTNGLPYIVGDPVALQQVLMNLMLNAIDAMKEMGHPGKLTISSQQTDNRQLLISVTDTGVGLPTGDAEQMFKAFFTSKPQGTGMGLPISRSIIELHGGRLWGTGNSGPGATFQFTLPVEAVARQSA